jgi:hypothetical protein
LLIEDPLELRLILAFRDAPPVRARPWWKWIEQLASLRTGRKIGSAR